LRSKLIRQVGDTRLLNATKPSNATGSRPHVIVDPAPGHAAEDPEPVPVRIKQHLVGLQEIGPDQKCPAVRQLDMGDLQLGALAAQNGKVLAPIELESLSRAERQRDERAAPGGLLLALAICPPVPRKGRDPALERVALNLIQIECNPRQASRW